MRRMTPRRGGFTLVELLIVVAILATLAALATFAFFRVRGSEQTRATDTTIQKLNMGLDAKWKAVLDDARDDLTKGKLDTLVAWAGNDKDRALAIWSYLKLKNEFPTSFQEAANPVLLADPVSGTLVAPPLPAKVYFRTPFKQTTTTTWVKGSDATRAFDESAVLFQWALSSSALRGMTFGQDGTTNQAGQVASPIPFKFGNPPMPAVLTPDPTDPTITATAYKDAYGVPIAFYRLAYSLELNNAPYTPNKIEPRKRTPDGLEVIYAGDPLDPKGTLPTIDPPSPTPGKWDRVKLLAFWQAATSGHLAYKWNPYGDTATAVFPSGATNGGVPDSYPFKHLASGSGVTITTFNLVPTLIAAGADKVIDKTDFIGSGDDQLGFRLRREGNRGN